MNWRVTVDGRPVDLRLDRDGDQWTVNGRQAAVLEVEPGIYSVILDGQSYALRVERERDGLFVNLRAHRYAVEVLDPRRLTGFSRRYGGEGRQSVVAPMPGRVVRLLVSEGDRVEAGAGLVVIEAMKMQNEMKASKPGRVVSLTAREGATVAAGEVLAIVE